MTHGGRFEIDVFEYETFLGAIFEGFDYPESEGCGGLGPSEVREDIGYFFGHFARQRVRIRERDTGSSVCFEMRSFFVVCRYVLEFLSLVARIQERKAF